MKTIWLYVFIVVVSLALYGCTSHTVVEIEEPITPSYSLPPATTGELKGIADDVTSLHGESKSTAFVLDRNDDSLRYRLLLIDLAEKSLDLQTFIWHDDATGNLMMDRILSAAERGVKIRLLVDDMLILDLEDMLPIALHPNIEIRIFNPWYGRGSILNKGVEFVKRMDQLNMRMHNKLLVADNHLTIVGGRNIGDEYFGISSKFNFRDLDVLTIGPIAEHVSRSFDNFWNYDWSYPLSSVVKTSPSDADFERARSLITEEVVKNKELLEQFTLEPHSWTAEIQTLIKDSSSGSMQVIYDHPPSPETGNSELRSLDKINQLGVTLEEELLAVMAYYIPREQDLDKIRRLVESGVTVKILTNSLGSNDQIITNSGYKYTRRPTLEAGAELYETHYFAKDRDISEDPRVQAKWLGLHSKVLIADRKTSYVGSLNLDPRALHINFEMGLLIHDPILGEKLASIAERDMSPENSWRLGIGENNKLYWENLNEKVYRQPSRTFSRRIGDVFFSLLPIKDQL